MFRYRVRVPSPGVVAARLDVPGVGSALKRRLLNHFGSARGVRNASFEDLENAPGIGPSMARRIYEHFHPGAVASREAAG